MKKLLSCVISFLIIIGILFYLYSIHLPHLLIGRYLSPSDKLTKPDAIVVISGSNDRVEHAINLYQGGFASKMILSGAAIKGPVSNAKAMQIKASTAGVLNDDIILEEKATSTYENAIFTKDIIKSQGFHKIILVTSPYHQRRAYETFKYVLGGLGVQILNSPSSDESSWKAESWWHSEEDSKRTKNELLKIIWAKISGNYN